MSVEGALNPAVKKATTHSKRDEDVQKFADSQPKPIPAEVLILKGEKPIPDYSFYGAGRDIIRRMNEAARLLRDRYVKDVTARYNDLIGDMHRLQGEIDVIKSAPLNKDDFIEEALENFREGRDEIKRKILCDYLKACQEKRSKPFTGISVRTEIFKYDEYWKLIYLLFSEKDIRQAGKELSGDGLSLRERAEKIQQIEGKIREIGESIEKELKGLGLAMNDEEAEKSGDLGQ